MNTLMMPAAAARINHVIAFDVSKASLSLHILPSGEALCLKNDGAAIRRFLKREQKRNRKQDLGAMLVICEATGGYEDAVLKAACTLGLECHRAHGSSVRAYAKSPGPARQERSHRRGFDRRRADSKLAAVAPVGLAPYDRDSGKERGKRRIFAGRSQVRTCLYMAALAAIRSHAALKVASPIWDRITLKHVLLRSRLALRLAGMTKCDASGVRHQLVSLAKLA